MCYRVSLELDIRAAVSSGKFTVARDLSSKIQSLNVVRSTLDKNLPYNYDYGSVSPSSLVWVSCFCAVSPLCRQVLLCTFPGDDVVCSKLRRAILETFDPATSRMLQGHRTSRPTPARPFRRRTVETFDLVPPGRLQAGRKPSQGTDQKKYVHTLKHEPFM